MKKAKIDGTTILLISILIIAVGLLIYTIPSTIDLFKNKNERQSSANTPARMSRMSLTGFDKQLARQLMDTNNDGRCDVCGMPVEQCIDAGELQCNMGVNSKMGVLGAQHIHADWKIYVNGEPFNWSSLADRHERQMAGDKSVQDTSAFMHIHPAQEPEKGGDVLHMHATGVPLWIFFKSVGMDFNKESLTLPDGRKFSNDGKNTLKFYVNDKPNNEWENYVFNDLDKILISYGNEIDLTDQISSITNFAGNH